MSKSEIVNFLQQCNGREERERNLSKSDEIVEIFAVDVIKAFTTGNCVVSCSVALKRNSEESLKALDMGICSMKCNREIESFREIFNCLKFSDNFALDSDQLLLIV